MAIHYLPEYLERFKQIAEIAALEVSYLEETVERLFAVKINASWVAALKNQPDLAERVDAFVVRYGRLQDTIGDKLLPRLAQLVGEKDKSFIDRLNWAERLRLIENAREWIELRNLRNRLIHEYMKDPEIFANDLNHAQIGSQLLIQTYRNIMGYVKTTLELKI